MYIRIILFGLLIYLIIRMIRQFFDGGDNNDKNISNSGGGRKVSDDTGEYVDYEEIKD